MRLNSLDKKINWDFQVKKFNEKYILEVTMGQLALEF